MALFGRDYDREFGSRGGMWGGGMWGGGMRDRGYDRGFRSGAGYSDRNDAYLRQNRYEPDMNRGSGMYGYDRDFGAPGYDRGYKSRWQTDYGDPFGDRAAHTPMRMIRGEYRTGYDRGYAGNERMGGGYGRDYQSNPMGYDPYAGRDGTWRHGNDRYRGAYGRDYEGGGWF